MAYPAVVATETRLPPIPGQACACQVCRAGEIKPLFAKGGYRYVCCAACGTAALDPLPAPVDACALYGTSYFKGTDPGGYRDYAADAALHRLNARARLDRLSRCFAGSPACAPTKVVDVGCAHGYFLEAAVSSGWTAVGVDVSVHAAEAARRELGIQVYPDLCSVQAQWPGQADMVTFFQSLEHMVDPTTSLAQAHEILRPGGLVAIETWDRQSLVARACGRHWAQVSPPTVVWMWSRKGLRLALEAAGLELLVIERWRKQVSLGFVASLLAEKYPLLRKSLRAVARWAPIASRGVSYSLGDLILAIARRPTA